MADYAPYRSSDILYVRETWNSIRFGNGVTVPFYTEYWYKADDTSQNPDDKWRPSIHMPREAAWIFLRVTDVRVERLQDMTIEESLREGVKLSAKECVAGKPPLVRFAGVWDDTIKKRDRALYGWDANPWVWVIAFERCEKPEGERHGRNTER